MFYWSESTMYYTIISDKHVLWYIRNNPQYAYLSFFLANGVKGRKANDKSFIDTDKTVGALEGVALNASLRY